MPVKLPSIHLPNTWSNYYNKGIANPNFMNTTDTVNAEIQEFADYVFSFYGSSDALYPMKHNKTNQLVTKYEILLAINVLMNEYKRRKNDQVPFTYGGGDSLDRERVRDILVKSFDFDKDMYGGSI
tara:strand:+ start:457 stop:834 length:378 start_codon:yes stop_codon:yes gene_type:complete